MNRLLKLATPICIVFFFSLVLFPLSTQAASSATTVTATTASGATVVLPINGNITSSQMNNIKIATNQSALTATLSFIVISAAGTTGFSNITIPKSAVSYGTKPTISIDGKPASSQGFTQDSNSNYVWYTTSFSNAGQSIGFVTHVVSIVFTQTSSTSSPSPTNSPSSPNSESNAQIVGITLAVVLIIIISVAVIIILRKRKT